MPDIKPFRAISYNPSSVNIADVVAPPYDVISPQRQDELYAASPYNVVRLDFGKEEDRYTSAAKLLGKWLADGILIQDETPAIYAVVQEFSTPSGKLLQRYGFVALCRLEEFGKGSILPHEKTLSRPKEDRLQLLQTTHAAFSQVFCVYDDPKRTVETLLRHHCQKNPPAIDVSFENVQNRVWKIVETEKVETIRKLMSRQKVLVADGHHRYETALEFQKTMIEKNPAYTGNESYNFIMMYFANMHDRGLIILPTHRLVYDLTAFSPKNLLQQLSLYFRVDRQSHLDELLSALRRKQRHTFGLILGDEPRYHLFSLMHENHLRSIVPPKIPHVLRELDVTILHAAVLEKILGIPSDVQKQKLHLVYTKDAHEAEDAVAKGNAQAAFLMNPPSLDQIRTVAEAGKTMPQKSTYFYPKLLSGLIMYSLDHE